MCTAQCTKWIMMPIIQYAYMLCITSYGTFVPTVDYNTDQDYSILFNNSVTKDRILGKLYMFEYL